MHYAHTQTAPMYLIPLGVGVLLALAAVPLWEVPVAGVTLASAGGAIILLASCFRSLTVEDAGDAVELRYGPLPVFRRRFAYADIESVERGRSSLIDSWGIHWVPGRGWTYNLWGRDCVRMQVRGGTVRIGTDEPEALLALLRSKTSP